MSELFKTICSLIFGAIWKVLHIHCSISMIMFLCVSMETGCFLDNSVVVAVVTHTLISPKATMKEGAKMIFWNIFLRNHVKTELPRLTPVEIAET